MIKKILIGLAVVILLVIGLIATLSFVAPTEMNFSRDVVVNKPKSEVFAYVKLIKNQNEWGPWFKQDPAMRQDSTGTDGKPGYISKWQSHVVGSGEQEIKGIKDGERIDTQIPFTEPFESNADSYITVESVNEGQSKVTWGFKSDTPRPFNVIGLVINMEDFVAPDFERGLADLKTIMESR